MTPQQLIEYAASQPEVALDERVSVHGPALTELLASGRAIPLLEMISHPDQHEAVRRFRYGHLLGPGASRSSIEEWQTRNASARFHSDVVELLTRVDGIHLWADLERARAYFGIRPLSEWAEVARSEWAFLFESPCPELSSFRTMTMATTSWFSIRTRIASPGTIPRTFAIPER